MTEDYATVFKGGIYFLLGTRSCFNSPSSGLRDRTELGKTRQGEDFPQAKAHTQPHAIVSFSFPRDHFRPLEKAGLLVLVSGATKYSYGGDR